MAPPGFSRSPDGYAIYVYEMPFLRHYRLVLYGLKVFEVSTVQGKSDILFVKMRCHQVERYVENFISSCEKTARLVGDLLTSSVHEIRAINTDVKHASQEIVSGFEPSNIYNDIVRKAYDINALTEIMSRRTDFLEFVANPHITRIRRERTCPYRKFDKVKRSLESRARQRKIRMDLFGSSVGEIDGLVVFDVIPYLIVQNAVKYSPEHERVCIEASEDDREIRFRVTNLGPKIDAEESEAIFEQGVRGRRAAGAGVKGSGFG